MFFLLLFYLLQIYMLLLIARALMSWFMGGAGPGLQKVDAVLATLTEPVLRPIRKVIPPVRIGGSYLDLSIIVVFVVIQFVLLPLLRR